MLIVSPHFPPVNAPDHQRVRLVLPYLARQGWAAEVLSVDPAFVEAAHDPDSPGENPTGVPIHRVRALPFHQTRRWGWGSLGRRAFPFLREAGHRLLASGRFDLVFFSTTQFGVLPLGPLWRRRFGVPYLVDLQDEWVTSYYRGRNPPGGRLKFALSQGMARFHEKRVLPHAAAIVAVSPHYLQRAAGRHPGIDSARLHVLPFGAEPADLKQTGAHRPPCPKDDRSHWVHVGRGGADLHHGARAFFAALRNAIDLGQVIEEKLRLHFIGTSYAPQGRPSFTPIAAGFGLGHLVEEQTRRVPHPAALAWLRAADALLLFGSDDSSYHASKAFPYLLARKPLLALAHQDGPLIELLRRDPSATVLGFDPARPRGILTQAIRQKWFAARAFEQTISAELPEAIPTACEMTRVLAEIFQQACAELPAQ